MLVWVDASETDDFVDFRDRLCRLSDFQMVDETLLRNAKLLREEISLCEVRGDCQRCISVYIQCYQYHPSAIFFFGVHTILHDILGIDTIITRYLRYFTSANMFKICIFLLLKARSGDS